jgi:hypothetical protein
MRTLIGLGILAVALAAVVVARRGQKSARSAGTRAVRLRDVPSVLAAVSTAGKDGTFAVFLFGPAGEAPAPMDALNVQFSIAGVASESTGCFSLR